MSKRVCVSAHGVSQEPKQSRVAVSRPAAAERERRKVTKGFAVTLETLDCT